MGGAQGERKDDQMGSKIREVEGAGGVKMWKEKRRRERVQL